MFFPLTASAAEVYTHGSLIGARADDCRACERHRVTPADNSSFVETELTTHARVYLSGTIIIIIIIIIINVLIKVTLNEIRCRGTLQSVVDAKA